MMIIAILAQYHFAKIALKINFAQIAFLTLKQQMEHVNALIILQLLIMIIVVVSKAILNITTHVFPVISLTARFAKLKMFAKNAIQPLYVMNQNVYVLLIPIKVSIKQANAQQI
jgi:hypothetical protein